MTTRSQNSPKQPPVTAQVRVFIARRPEIVFDYFADLRNEPQYNPQVRSIIKTSPDPIAQNTMFEGLHRGFGHVTWQLSEYDRPKHLVIEGHVGQGVYRWVSDFEAAEGGTWMTGRMEWQPAPVWRLFRPLLAAVIRWNAHRSFHRMAEILQRRAPSPTG